MKCTLILLIGLLTGCKTPKENFQQAYEASLVEGRVMMTVLQALDSGDVRKTRKLGMLSLHLTLSFLPDYAAEADPTAEQRQEERAFARDVLDYMLVHRDELDPRLGSVRMGIRGLQKILTQPEDVQRLTELSDYLAGVEKNMSGSP